MERSSPLIKTKKEKRKAKEEKEAIRERTDKGE
jgi:hypothetical protein